MGKAREVPVYYLSFGTEKVTIRGVEKIVEKVRYLTRGRIPFKIDFVGIVYESSPSPREVYQ